MPTAAGQSTTACRQRVAVAEIKRAADFGAFAANSPTKVEEGRLVQATLTRAKEINRNASLPVASAMISPPHSSPLRQHSRCGGGRVRTAGSKRTYSTASQDTVLVPAWTASARITISPSSRASRVRTTPGLPAAPGRPSSSPAPARQPRKMTAPLHRIMVPGAGIEPGPIK